MQKLGMLTSSPTCLKMTENSCPLIGHWFLSLYLQLAVVGNSTWREGCFAAPIKPCFDETILECRQVWLLFPLLPFYSWCISSKDLDQNQEGAALWGGGQCTLLGGVDLTAPGTSGVFLTLLPSWVKHHGEAAFELMLKSWDSAVRVFHRLPFKQQIIRLEKGSRLHPLQFLPVSHAACACCHQRPIKSCRGKHSEPAYRVH